MDRMEEIRGWSWRVQRGLLIMSDVYSARRRDAV